MRLQDVCVAIVDCEHKTAPKGDGYALSVGTKAMKGGRLVRERCKPVSAKTYLAWSRRRTPVAGDLILAREAPVGDVIRIPDDVRVCLGQRTVLISADPSCVDPRFLHYWLLGPDAQAEMHSRAAGATVPHLNVEDIRELNASTLPRNLDHQRAAGRLLGAIDDLIENNWRRIALLEQMAQAIYREWFVHFRYPGHENDELVDSPRGPIPEGWELLRLGELVQLHYGKALKAASRRGGSVAVAGSSGIVGWHDEALVNGPVIVIGRKGNVGSVTWIASDSWPIDTTYWVETELPPHFAYEMLKEVEFIDSHAAVPGLSRDQAYSLELIRPSMHLVREFATIASGLKDMLVVLMREGDVLMTIRDSLLPRFVTGAIDVSRLDLDALLDEPTA